MAKKKTANRRSPPDEQKLKSPENRALPVKRVNRETQESRRLRFTELSHVFSLANILELICEKYPNVPTSAVLDYYYTQDEYDEYPEPEGLILAWRENEEVL